MKSFNFKKLFVAFVLAGLSLSAVNAQEAPKNIIVFISDGCGYNHIAATKYWHGTDSNSYEKFDVHYPMSTYSSSVNKMWEDNIDGYNSGYNSFLAWTDWEWMQREGFGGPAATGSAPAATSMASGVKSMKYSVGVDIDSTILESITERAIALGKTSGVVTSVQISHATPAGFSAHNNNRKAYADIAKNQILDSNLSVLMGCGHPYFDNNGDPVTSDQQFKYVGGQAMWDSIAKGVTVFSKASPNGRTEVQDIDGDGSADAWALIEDSADFANLITGATPKRVLGIPKVGSTLQHSRDGNYRDTDPFAVPLTENIPRLHHMTRAALNVLKNNDNDNGFFLMVEGGAVDWAGHGNSLTRIIEEQTDFDAAVDSTIEWLAANGELENTLIIVTSDHETGYLTGPDFDTANLNMPVQYPVVDNGAGQMPGHKFMSNNAYGTQPEAPSGEHTNQLVPLFAKGPGAENFAKYADEEDFVRGKFIDNTDLGHLMMDLWEKEQRPEPKNVILLISDGWSDNHLLAANLFMGETQEFESWSQAYMSTHPAIWDKNWKITNESYDAMYNPYLAWTQEDWIKRDGGAGATGSAAAATAMYTGVKSATYAIGVDIHGNALKTFCERASEIGKSTGVVTSVQFAHATPGSMLAHNNSRKEYAAIANEMLLNSKASVIIGCGAPDYDHNGQFIADEASRQYKYVGGKDTWLNLWDEQTTFDSMSKGNNLVQDVNNDGNPDAWTLVRDSIEFVNLAGGKTPLRVLGIPNVSATLQYNRDNNDAMAFADKFVANVPSLAEMTAGALNVLDNNSNGFALMIEGGAVDWAGHGNDLDGIIEEQNDFNKTVDAVVKWVNDSSSWEKTMVIVTGDHETGYLVGDNWDPTDMANTYGLVDAGQGEMPGGKFLSGDHTNMLIPLYVKGVGASVLTKYADHHDFHKGRYLDNTEIGQAILKMWEASPNASPVINQGSVLTSIDDGMPISTKSNIQVNIYPTVTDGNLIVEVEETPSLLKVYSLNGRIVQYQTLNSNKTTLNLSNNPKGVYIVEVMSNQKNDISKIILK